MYLLFKITTERANARQTGEVQQTKVELHCQYLMGPRFRYGVEAIVEKFKEMQEDLELERITMTRMWAKREGKFVRLSSRQQEWSAICKASPASRFTKLKVCKSNCFRKSHERVG